jgi:hypothetical protein
MYKQEPVAPYTAADRAFSKLKYSVRKNKPKKEPRVEETSKFSTLQEAYDKNIEMFQKRKKKNPKDAKQIEQEEIEYLMNTIPFIKEYKFESAITDEKDDEDEDGDEDGEEDEKDDVPALFNVKSTNTNKRTFNKYLYTVENVVNSKTASSVMEVTTQDHLATCQCGGHLIHHAAVADLVCDRCGEVQQYIESYSKEEEKEVGMAYKRINHLTECLNALQGKEGTTVPDEVIEKVRAEFKKNRISRTSEIKPSKVKQYLKKLGYSSYYENIHTIANTISGMPMLKLSPELEKKLKDMFNLIQDPFYRHKSPKRKNFLSYNYVLYKFCELLGEDDLLIHFPLLKCQKNLHIQDTIWRKICEELSWEYIATV